jgi:hypothetical protein
MVGGCLAFSIAPRDRNNKDKLLQIKITNMKNVLIIGSTGQIGSELTMKLRELYNGNIVAGYIPGAEPSETLRESGPCAIVDITNEQQIAETVSKYKIDTIYNLAALLSAVAEAKPQLAWKIGLGGLFNVLEVARTMNCAVFTPSSIGVFGNNTPKDKTPQDTIRSPRTMYGVTKVSGELLSDYYHIRFGVDTRSVRFPGLISYVTPPGGGTTDYAVEIYYAAVKGEDFACPIQAGSQFFRELRQIINSPVTDPFKRNLIHKQIKANLGEGNHRPDKGPVRALRICPDILLASCLGQCIILFLQEGNIVGHIQQLRGILRDGML